jgi:hypothetical protein
LPEAPGPQSLSIHAGGRDDLVNFACPRASARDDFKAMSHFKPLALAALMSVWLASAAMAGPPSYLLLRQTEAPGPHLQPGHPAAIHYDVRARGYAYGYFGVAPRTHHSRHFGIHRDYTQWSRW